MIDDECQISDSESFGIDKAKNGFYLVCSHLKESMFFKKNSNGGYDVRYHDKVLLTEEDVKEMKKIEITIYVD